ncbi:MAG: hypothetical protein HS130_11860 [Deltaproteobacteria bacterium]|nr:hypothetical protein [Deltaproteobacteria bacterium]
METSEGARKAAISELEKALAETREKLARETDARRRLELEIARLSKETELVSRSGMDPAGLAKLQDEFANLRTSIARSSNQAT